MNRLVLASVGDGSRHPRWLKGEPAFDLWLVYYGDSPGRYEGQAARVWDRKGGKWHNLAWLLEQEEVERYQAVFLPDDDLELDSRAINRLFDRAAQYELALAQPAFTWDSLARWGITLVRPWMMLRYTNFVENGAVLFSREALAACRHTFKESLTGFGLDLLWPLLLGYPQRRVAVVDDVPCRHPQRPSELDKLVPREDHRLEGGRLLQGRSLRPVSEEGFVLNPAGEAMVAAGKTPEAVRRLSERYVNWIRRSRPG